MNPQQLMSWIQNHERKAGSMGFMDRALGMAGTSLIGGAAAAGLTGVAGPSVINSAISSGLETATGMNRRASGGLINILRNKE